MELSKENIQYFVDFIKKETGMSMSLDKEYLFESRLAPVVRKLDLNNYDELISEIRFRRAEAVQNTINALTTNETYFFRDFKPFDFLQKEIFPKLIENTADGNTINIWSAACSSGQEPYSIAMSVLENRQKIGNRKINIYATDISSKVIEKARRGIYNQFEIQRGLPASLMVKYMSKKDEDYWEVKDELKNMINFFEDNLLGEYQKLPALDLVFCRNVLIYFDSQTKQKILSKIAMKLKTGGYVFLGTSETSNLLPEMYDQNKDMRSVYIKK